MKKGVLLAFIIIILVFIVMFFYATKTDVDDELVNTFETTSEAEQAEATLSFEERVWEERIVAAVAPVDCPPVVPRNYLNGYYSGRLIDSHFHISGIPDSTPFLGARDEFGDGPILGVNVKIGDIVCTLRHEGTERAFAFFPVYKQISEQMIEVVRRTQQNYPDTFIPFIMPPDSDDRADGSPTVDAATLETMLEIEPGLFEGYGEVGLYARGDHGGPTGSAALAPDAPRLLAIYPIVREHGLVVYVHLGEGQQESFERALDANPDITFIWHGDQLISYSDGQQNLSAIEEILEHHPNARYGVDELYGDVWLLRPEVSKEDFFAHFEDYEPLLEKDLATWKAFIERHPDQVMWGTDRGWSATWSIDRDVGFLLTDYARAFIGKLDTSVQEKFAYRNAERLMR